MLFCEEEEIDALVPFAFCLDAFLLPFLGEGAGTAEGEGEDAVGRRRR